MRFSAALLITLAIAVPGAAEDVELYGEEAERFLNPCPRSLLIRLG